jgi:hypothetical protein
VSTLTMERGFTVMKLVWHIPEVDQRWIFAKLHDIYVEKEHETNIGSTYDLVDSRRVKFKLVLSRDVTKFILLYCPTFSALLSPQQAPPRHPPILPSEPWSCRGRVCSCVLRRVCVLCFTKNIYIIMRWMLTSQG